MMLKLNDLSIFYGTFKALVRVSLELDKGEVITVLGSNGAGKTSLLLTISGLVKTAEGHIIFNDEKI